MKVRNRPEKKALSKARLLSELGRMNSRLEELESLQRARSSSESLQSVIGEINTSFQRVRAEAVELGEETVSAWLDVINLTAQLSGCSSVVVYRFGSGYANAILANGSPENPVKIGCRIELRDHFLSKIPMPAGFFSKKNILSGADTFDYPETNLGIRSVICYSLSWPSGENFGALCLYEKHEIEVTDSLLRTLLLARNYMEKDLALLFESSQLNFTLHQKAENFEQLNIHREKLEHSVLRKTEELSAMNAALKNEVKSRKNAEELLRLRSTALEATELGVVITNVRGDIVWTNRAFSNMTGYGPDELIYKNISILKSGAQDQEFYRSLWSEILKGNVWQGELKNLRKDGTLYTEKQCISPVPDDSGNIKYFVAVKEDISEKIAREEIARQEQEKLVQADKMVSLGTLVSGVAHEINNPNNFIMLNVPILEKAWNSVLPILDEHMLISGDFSLGAMKYSRLRESIPSLLKGIMDGSERIKNIVGELKDFSRKEPPDMDQTVNINHVIKAAVLLTSNLINKSTTNFSIDYGVGIPPVRGNFRRLEQVLINLIENACQALTDKEQYIRVKSGFVSEEGSVILAVEDSGCGMNEKIIRAIKDPFFTTKRHSGGTGLGLSVSNKIIIHHGGTLSFRSATGIGTIAEIRLPMIRTVPEGDGR